jgi:hypothetical protein
VLAPLEFGDGAITIEGPSASTGYMQAHGHVVSGSTRDRADELSSVTKSYITFTKTSDYFSEERLFVVLIRKKGVTGALQDLRVDQHPRMVCMFSPLFSSSQPSDVQLPRSG